MSRIVVSCSMSSSKILVVGLLGLGGFAYWAMQRNAAIGRSEQQAAVNYAVRLAELDKLLKDRRGKMEPYEKGIRTLQWEPTARVQVAAMREDLAKLQADIQRFEAEKADLLRRQKALGN